MKNEPLKTHPLMHSIPRGLTTKRLGEQTAPMSRFLNPHELKKVTNIAYDPKNPGGKILLGKLDHQLIGIDDDRHIMTIAGSRAGKSVTLIGNLLLYPGSVLATDPKGELAEKSAAKRSKMGQKVYLLAPFDNVQGNAATFSARYNPMKILTLDNLFIIEDTLLITDGIVTSTGDEKDPHWNESASHFIMGVILYVALSPYVKEEDRHLIKVRYYINHALDVTKLPPENEGEKPRSFYTFQKMADECASILIENGHEDIAETMLGAINGFYEKGTEERGSVLSTVRRHTQFLSFKSMINVLSGHDFDLTDFKRVKGGITVYLSLPATRMGMCHRWLRIIINQLIDAMEREPQKPDIPILVALDEFPVLGFMKQLQDAAGQIASFGVRLWIIMQDWGQGKALYKERFESFAANAGILQCFGNVDLTTTEYISKRMGQTLIQTTRKSETLPNQIAEGLKGDLNNRQQYPLMTADEVARTFARDDPQKRQLIFYAGKSPMVLERVEYFKKDSHFFNSI